MSEEKQFVPVCDKQGVIVGKAFTVVDKNPRVTWRTNYSWYLKKAAEKKLDQNVSLRPFIGRFTDAPINKDFEVYMDGEWVKQSFWDDWTQPVLNDGIAVLNKAGKPKQAPFFTEYHEFLLKFDEPIDVAYWDKDLKQNVIEAFEEFYVRVSKNTSKKILKEVNDDRNPSDAKFILNYDKNEMPADQYSVQYVKG